MEFLLRGGSGTVQVAMGLVSTPHPAGTSDLSGEQQRAIPCKGGRACNVLSQLSSWRVCSGLSGALARICWKWGFPKGALVSSAAAANTCYKQMSLNFNHLRVTLLLWLSLLEFSLIQPCSAASLPGT